MTFGDVSALAGRLQQWATDPAQASAMGQAGRQRVEREFSLHAMVDRYETLYDRLLAQRT